MEPRSASFKRKVYSFVTCRVALLKNTAAYKHCEVILQRPNVGCVKFNELTAVDLVCIKKCIKENAQYSTYKLYICCVEMAVQSIYWKERPSYSLQQMQLRIRGSSTVYQRWQNIMARICWWAHTDPQPAALCVRCMFPVLFKLPLMPVQAFPNVHSEHNTH